MNPKKFLKLIHSLHYLQYPFLIIGLGYSFKKYFIENSDKWADMNMSLLFFGIGLSFAGFADVKKIGGWSKKIMRHPRMSKLFIFYSILLSFGLMATGFYAMFQIKNSAFKEVSIGLIVLGIGVISLIKMSVELMESNAVE